MSDNDNNGEIYCLQQFNKRKQEAHLHICWTYRHYISVAEVNTTNAPFSQQFEMADSKGTIYMSRRKQRNMLICILTSIYLTEIAMVLQN